MDIMKQKINRISIDLDTPSIKVLLLAYINAKKWFRDVPIDVEISSSGAGFHIIIHKEVTVKENLMWRALLGDDPVRISYSLRRMLLNDDKDIVDIIFIRKSGRVVRRINIDKIFNKYGIDPTDVDDSNFKQVYDTVYGDISTLIGNIYYLVIPFNKDIDDNKLDELYNNEGIKIQKTKSYEKEYLFYLVIRKIGDNNFDEEKKIIKKYIPFSKHWIKKETIK